MSFKVKAILCDLDGTLLDTAPQIAEAANHMLAALGRPVLPVPQVASFIGNGVQVLIQRCLNATSAGMSAEHGAKAQALFNEAYSANATLSLPFAGVQAGLQLLKQRGFSLACVTNKPEAFSLPLLAKSGLADFFEAVVSGDTLPEKKPHPMHIHHVCAILKIAESETLLVGDSDTDIATARSAGCLVVTVPYGYNQGKPIDVSKVDACISNLTELAELLA